MCNEKRYDFTEELTKNQLEEIINNAYKSQDNDFSNYFDFSAFHGLPVSDTDLHYSNYNVAKRAHDNIILYFSSAVKFYNYNAPVYDICFDNLYRNVCKFQETFLDLIADDSAFVKISLDEEITIEELEDIIFNYGCKECKEVFDFSACEPLPYLMNDACYNIEISILRGYVSLIRIYFDLAVSYFGTDTKLFDLSIKIIIMYITFYQESVRFIKGNYLCSA